MIHYLQISKLSTKSNELQVEYQVIKASLVSNFKAGVSRPFQLLTLILWYTADSGSNKFFKKMCSCSTEFYSQKVDIRRIATIWQ